MIVKLSHCLVQIKTKDQYEYPTTFCLENGVDQEAYNEQDKQQRLIVKAKDKMIGIIVFFPDVYHPNEDREER